MLAALMVPHLEQVWALGSANEVPQLSQNNASAEAEEVEAQLWLVTSMYGATVGACL